MPKDLDKPKAMTREHANAHGSILERCLAAENKIVEY